MTSRPQRPVRAIFLGSGRFAQPALGRLAAHPSVDLAAVVTAPPRPVGRHQRELPTPIENQARELGLAVQTPVRMRDEGAIAAVVALKPDLLVLADYGRIVPPALLELRFGALNLHPSLLPRHRGATPIPAAILAGDTETGVTLFRMDAGVDTGPIIAVERSTLGAQDTAPAVEARLAITAAGVLARALDPWLDGEIIAEPQPSEGATLTRPLRRADGALDPRQPAAALERRVRAFQPWPGTFFEADDQRVVVLAASVAPSDADDELGRLVPDPAGLAVATSDGRFVLLELQPAGGRPMSGEAFLRGRPSILGRSIVAPVGAAAGNAEPA
ncbi:MAG TPA: methionyl-tRNA formyltransferase [Candidatus Limnocylindrales bacterium]